MCCAGLIARKRSLQPCQNRAGGPHGQNPGQLHCYLCPARGLALIQTRHPLPCQSCTCSKSTAQHGRVRRLPLSPMHFPAVGGLPALHSCRSFHHLARPGGCIQLVAGLPSILASFNFVILHPFLRGPGIAGPCRSLLHAPCCVLPPHPTGELRLPSLLLVEEFRRVALPVACSRRERRCGVYALVLWGHSPACPRSLPGNYRRCSGRCGREAAFATQLNMCVGPSRRP